MKHLGHHIQSWFRSGAPAVTAAAKNERLTIMAIGDVAAGYDAKNIDQSNQQQTVGKDLEVIDA